MKSFKNYMMRPARALKKGSALSAAIFAACALQAQTPGITTPQTPAPGDSTAISHPAQEFLQDAAQANQTEIAMANVAEAKSQNNMVKEMAKMMRSDHQQNYAQLQVLAQNHSFALESSLNSKNQRAVNHLQSANDADFDKDYTKVMLKDHVKCIARFDKALGGEIEEPYVLAYARSTLPTLRNHLQHAEDTARSVGLDEATISSILKGLPNEETQRAVTAN